MSELSSRLAGDADVNGLDSQIRDLIADPTTIRLALIYYAPDGLQSIVALGHEARTGHRLLPFDQVIGDEE